MTKKSQAGISSDAAGGSNHSRERSAAGSAFSRSQTLKLRASHAPRDEVTLHRGKMAPSL